MSNRSATHSTFVIERDYDASPARVFAAWADVNAKGQWFGPGGEQEHELDFREGGREHFEAAVEGAVYSYDARLRRHRRRTSGSSTRTTCTATACGCRFR